MPVPVLSRAPAAPARTQDSATFNTRMAAMMAFIEGWPTELNAFGAALSDLVMLGFTTTSTTAQTIGTGAKTFAAGGGAAFVAGHSVLIKSDANPLNFMKGRVTAYDRGTGALTVDVTAVGGTGTFADWTIAITVGDGAALDSPAFTGTPTAPTAAPGTNTTQLANTAFVHAAVAALVAASPAALDTLNELAAALGNDANFATTVNNALAARELTANLRSMAYRAKGAAADLHALTADVGITADVMGAAYAPVALAFATTLAWDWRGGYYRGPVIFTANGTVALPTNIRAGEVRLMDIEGDTTTARTVSFAAGFKGPIPSITDMTSAKKYRLIFTADTGGTVTVAAEVRS